MDEKTICEEVITEYKNSVNGQEEQILLAEGGIKECSNVLNSPSFIVKTFLRPITIRIAVRLRQYHTTITHQELLKGYPWNHESLKGELKKIDPVYSLEILKEKDGTILGYRISWY